MLFLYIKTGAQKIGDYRIYCNTKDYNQRGGGEQLPIYILLLKGPLKYLLRPLLGKNQFAVTQRTYACIGPNLDTIY